MLRLVIKFNNLILIAILSIKMRVKRNHWCGRTTVVLVDMLHANRAIRQLRERTDTPLRTFSKVVVNGRLKSDAIAAIADSRRNKATLVFYNDGDSRLYNAVEILRSSSQDGRHIPPLAHPEGRVGTALTFTIDADSGNIRLTSAMRF